MDHLIEMAVGDQRLVVSLHPGEAARVAALGPTGYRELLPLPAQPLVEVLAVGHGRTHMNETHLNTAVGDRLRPVRHQLLEDDGAVTLEVVQLDDLTGLEVTSVLRVPAGSPGVQGWTTVRNTGGARVVLEAVTSIATGALLATGERVEDVDRLAGRSTWLGEARFEMTPVGGRDGLVDLDLARHQGQDRRTALVQSSAGSWSSGTWMPVGALVHRPTGRVTAWQVEHNGSWTVEVSERTHQDHRELVLLAMGPTSGQEWRAVLEPGQETTTVPVSLVAATGGLDGALAGLADHRRRLLALAGVGPLRTPVVFNDYMNTLMGDPTTDKLLPLVDAAAAVGAEVFCIDAGWYSDDDGWWDTVGAWTPSTTRFPRGLGEVLDRIRSSGMVPGLWLEPEVVGVRSPLATSLPPEAFCERDGVRVVEQGRHLLDLRHEAARKHLDAVVDHLVDDLGVGFFKLDYNVTPGIGIDGPETSPGANLLAHQRAVLSWLDGLTERHPALLLETCSSGGMRQDFATVSRANVQSTSDQQNFLLYPPIAAASTIALLPEQAGIWAYPQAGMTPDEMTFTLAGALLGRLYLSGYLNRMDPAQVAVVQEAVDAHQQVRDAVAVSAPALPWGPPAWDDPWTALALRVPHGETLLTLWARPGAEPRAEVPLPWLRGRDLRLETVFPRADASWSTAWSADEGLLRVRCEGAPPQARVLRLTVT